MKKTSVNITDDELWRKVKMECVNRGLKLGFVMEQCLRTWLKENTGKHRPATR